MQLQRLLAMVCVLAAVATAPLHANLIVNGDFESGNTGFTSAYTYAPLDPDGTYYLTTNPALQHAFATSYGDHTTGSGLMMAANGSTTPGLLLWSQTVAVHPGTLYTFSGWVSSWFPALPAVLSIRVNSVPIGQVVAPAQAGVWQPWSLGWSSGTNTSAVLSIIDLNLNAFGNDFAIDDLSFVPEPASLLVLGAGLTGLASLRRRRK